MNPKDADGKANSVDSDQTAPLKQSDLGMHFKQCYEGLHCLLRPMCSNI